MPVGITLKTRPIGSQLTSTIGSGEPESKNDFAVFISLDSNGTGLTESNLSVSHGAVVAVEGRGATWKATVRPPETAVAALTFTVAANAFSEGNTETTLDIRVSTSFPDADAETPTELFTPRNSNGIAVSPTRIFVGSSSTVYAYTHDGTEQTAEEATLVHSFGSFSLLKLDFFNNTLIVNSRRDAGRFLFDGTLIQEYRGHGAGGGVTTAHTPFGIFTIIKQTTVPSREFNLFLNPYDSPDSSDSIDISNDFNFGNGISHPNPYIAVQNDLIYTTEFLLRITENNEIELIKRLNIDDAGDIAIYRDTLYLREDTGTDRISTVDIRPYRPLAKNTKTTIYPIFATNGDTIPLKQFCPDGKEFVFSVGFDKPDYLSINTSDEIAITSNAVTETTPVLVRVTGINFIDSVDFSFYLIIVPATAPEWRDVESLSMKAHTSYDLHQIVDADEIAFESGETQPTGSSIANGIFTIGTTAGTARFTATKGSLTTDTAIVIDVIQAPDPDNFSDITRHKVEIAGIDVTADLIADTPLRVDKSLDSVELTRYRAHSVSVPLRNPDGKYNPDRADNFWATNSLNAGGFQENIKIYLESFINEAWVSTLLFTGIIDNQAERFTTAQVSIRAKDVSAELQRRRIRSFGTLEKWARLRQQSDEATFEAVYVPEGSLSPVQPESGKAWIDRTELTLRQLQLPSRGVGLANTGYLSANDLRTSGGFLENPPVLNAKALPRSEDVRFLIAQCALNGVVYNTDIQLTDVELEDPTILNRGSVPYSVENTRITRLPTDWVHDSTNDRLLSLLSNPEGHIADLLVQYDLESDTYRTLHTFDKDISVHRIARRNSTDYYILSAKALTQDRSAATLPRAVDATGYAYDAIAAESDIKILRYNASTNTLTEHVDADDTRPPQLGIHYHIGFENDIYIDEFEGIRPDDRGAFKFQGSNLYYRYATASEFGVARVNTSGTTTEMISETDLAFHNHLNFAFDVTSGGDIYFVYAEHVGAVSELIIKRRTNGGVESTRFQGTHIGAQAYLGCYECLFHNNFLYLLVPIQHLDLGDDFQSIINPDVNIKQLTAEKTGERDVTTSTNLNPANLTLSPGDDIPLRIDFNGTVTGATQDDLTVYGGTIESFSISSDMIDVTIRPDDTTVHKTIIVDLSEDAVDQTNEAWRITIDFETTRSRTKAAGSVLYRCDVTNANPSLTVLDQWDFATLGGCNLIVHDGAVHFMEQPPAAAQITPINPDLDTYNETMGYNVIPEGLGALKKVESDGSVTELGNLWYDDRPYNQALTRTLSFDDELHLMMGYGNTNELLRYNSLASKADNFVHLVYTTKLSYILPTFSTDGNIYSKLATLARQTGATLSFDGNIISVVTRRAFRANTNGATGTGTGNLSFDGAKKPFPLSGYLRIGDEFIGYTGISSSAFTGITRGALGSAIVDHADDAGILYVDALFSERDILQLNPQTDTSRLANVIRDGESRFEARDDTSIDTYDEQPYSLNLGLTQNEDAWIETIFAEYLSELKDLGKAVSLHLPPRKKSFALMLGQVIGVRYGGLTYALRVESITHQSTGITVKARTVETA